MEAEILDIYKQTNGFSNLKKIENIIKLKDLINELVEKKNNK